MAKRKKPGRNKPGGKKVRVQFKTNRSARRRQTDFTHLADKLDDAEADVPTSERLLAKGDLSRKRTVIIDDDETIARQSENTHTGRVVTIYGRTADVDDGKTVWPCSIRRVLRTRSIDGRNPVSVGDIVRFTLETDREGVEPEGVIETVQPRHGQLKRVVGKKEHTVVANVDLAVIITAAKEPEPKPNLVDRYIVSALHGQIEPVICLNKIDTVTPKEADQFLKTYASIGYKTIATSATTSQGIDHLRELIKNKESVFAGQSGVGKSSLLNAIQPDLALEIGGLAAESGKGKHTTTRASLIKLNIGGYVVDTPGVRSFDLSNVPFQEIESYFVEFLKHIPHCKFPDCTHRHEIKCAVKTAVSNGQIQPTRYESYVRLFTDKQFR